MSQVNSYPMNFGDNNPIEQVQGRSISESMPSDIKEKDKGVSEPKKRTLLKRCFGWIPHWLRTIFYSVSVGTIVCGPPTFYWKFTTTAPLADTITNLAWFAIWFRVTFIIAFLVSGWIFIRYLILLIPNAIIWAARVLNIIISEKTKTRMEFLRTISKFLCATLIILVYLIAYEVTNSNTSLAFLYTWFFPGSDTYIIFCLICSFMLLVEKFMLQMIAASFHRVAYSDRILENNRKCEILDNLKAAVMDYVDDSEAYGTDQGLKSKLKMLGAKSGLTKFVRQTKYALNATANALIATKTLDVNSSEAAKSLANKLFDRMVDYGCNSLTIVSFLPYFDTEEEARNSLNLFDRNFDGDVTREEMCDRLVEIYRERKNLTSSLYDMEQCVGKLDKIMLIMFFIVGLLIALFMFSNNSLSTLTSYGTFALSLAFIFGQSVKDLFESLVFLFIVHPFDVGDRVIIENDNMVVKEMGVMITVFQGSQGQLIYRPNSIISKKKIYNIRRSDSQIDVIELLIDQFTSLQALEYVKMDMIRYLEEHHREYESKFEFRGFDITENACKVFVILWHKGNFQDILGYFDRKAAFMARFREVMIAHGVVCLPRPTVVHCRQIK